MPETGARSGAAMRAHRRPWSRRLRRVSAYLYILPALLLTTGILLYPIAFTTGLSLFRWDLLRPAVFVGLDNYAQLLRDPFLASSFSNTLYWVVGTLVLPVGFALLFALLLNHVPGQGIFKTVLFLPFVIAPTVVGLVWLFMYDPSEGVLQALLGLAGGSSLMANVLSNSPSNTIAMIIAATWRGLGVNMVLFLIGLQSIPTEVIEAAMLDGSSGFNFFRHITFPLLRPLTTVVVTLAVAAGFTTFDFVWVMTGGGPYRSSETLAVTMYRVSFVDFNFGYGAAIAVVLALIVSVFALLYLRNVVRS
jgi:multiple sugar transport system permease protein